MKLPQFLKAEIKLPKPGFKLRKGGDGSPKPKPAKVAKAKAAPKRQVRVPGFAEDLYRDMRDRRLLLPAALLVVAIIAVPIALSSSPEPAPPPVAYQPAEGSEAVSPAVVTEQPVGVRDYRERLNELNSKDPFAGSFTSEDGASGSGGGELVDPADASTPISTPSSSAPATSTSPSTGVASTPPDSSGTGGGSAGHETMIVLAPRIDVRGGPVHKRKRLKNVEIGDLVPDQRKAPIAMFVGVSGDLETAQFVVSDEVSDTDGDGKCRPRASRCEFLYLREDEKRYFTFGPDDERFSLKVTGIREEIVDRRKVKGS